MKKLLTIFIQFLIFSQIIAQEIKINEVSSSNSFVIFDIDGETPDWFELINVSENAINLSEYYISTDLENTNQWQFPELILQPDSLLLVFASGNSRTNFVRYWETIIREGESCKYLVPQSNPSSSWKTITYDDNSWTNGQLGVGYGDNDDNTTIPNTIAAYIRISFSVADIAEVSDLFFHCDFDDGFVAYLNGTEIARENLGQSGSAVYYNTPTTTEHEAQLYSGNSPSGYPLRDYLHLLQNEENILAIEVHNVSSSSSDLTLIPFLSLGYANQPQNPVGTIDFLNLKPTCLHTNFKLNADGEMLILFNQNEEIVDSLFTRNQEPDISVGRFPNGSENLFYFNQPTPGKLNENNGFVGFLESPIFNFQRGFYNSPINLQLININGNGNIHFTTDGSVPSTDSPIYQNSVNISQTRTIRAKIFGENLLPSPTQTHTFFIDEPQNLPIVSLSTNPEHFFDYDSGIYVMGPNADPNYPYFGANFWQDWERPIHIEFFELNGEFGFEMEGGIKIFGQWSRANGQKSLAFFARGEYGQSDIPYKLFPENEIYSYQNFVLRNSGNDWNRTMFRDALQQEIVMPLDIDKQKYRPVIVYLNGEYWGIHNLREKINESFIAEHYNIPTEDLNIIENNFQLVHGETGSYEDFYNSLNGMNLTTDDGYNYINSKVDIKEFIDYYLTEIFIDNRDWPGNNIKFWQQRSTNSPWRWILYDTDFGFGIWDQNAYTYNTLEFALATNGPDWPNPPWSTYLARRFLENEKFKNQFVARFSVYVNTLFRADSINNIISRFANRIAPEIPTHMARWYGDENNWQNEVNSLRTFANQRSLYMTLYFMNYFGINGQYDIEINQDISKGYAAIEELPIQYQSWSGHFFNNIPIEIQAIAKSRFVFSHWEGSVSSTENPITITSSVNVNLTPIFVQSGNAGQVVINEINYNSAETFNSEDWVEFYNSKSENIDLSNWIFKDSDDEHSFTFPQGTIINSDGFFVICRDTNLFKSKFPEATNYIGNLSFGLDGSGELIRLFNSDEITIDSLTYDDKTPWPEEPDGEGSSLELKNYTLDNSKYYNWSASTNYGTPSLQNSVFTSTENDFNQIPTEYKLSQNYPNPFNPSTTISYSIPQNSNVSLKIYDVIGKEVMSLVNQQQVAGNYEIEFNASNFSSGVYFYKLQSGNFAETRKMILVK